MTDPIFMLLKGDERNSALPSTLQPKKPLPLVGSGSKSWGGVGNSSQGFPLPPPLPLLPSSLFNQAAAPNTPTGVYNLLGPSPSSSLPRLVQTLPGSFPDIYDGDVKRWEQHFQSIQRAYKEFSKEDDFAIRVLTEDFTLPFPYAWPNEGEVSQQPAYDPADCSGFDFFLHPGQPVPRLLQPLHATTQAFFKKRCLEQLAVSYATQATMVGNPGLPSQDTSSPLRPDIMVIASMPCVPTTATVPVEPSFLVQDGKGHRNIQPAPVALPNSAPMQPINVQFISPTHQGPF